MPKTQLRERAVLLQRLEDRQCAVHADVIVDEVELSQPAIPEQCVGDMLAAVRAESIIHQVQLGQLWVRLQHVCQDFAVPHVKVVAAKVERRQDAHQQGDHSEHRLLVAAKLLAQVEHLAPRHACCTQQPTRK
eukprot:7380118-Prymnesium_polylepis.2